MHAGLIILDKPRGPTSHAVARHVKDLLWDFGVQKVGHGGTLDPNATGVLPLTLNDATRIQEVLLRGSKEYVGTLHLHGDAEEGTIRDIMTQFQGQIWQLPPSRSAIKREIRARVIDSIIVHEVRSRDVTFQVECEAGTYIRTLAVDVGKVLGCGAHLTALRRTRSGSFSESEGLASLEQIAVAAQMWRESHDPAPLAAFIHPIESAFASYPRIVVVDEAIHQICLGAGVETIDIAKLDPDIRNRQAVAIFSLKGEVVARGISLGSSEKITHARKGVIIRTRKAYIDPNIYPKLR